MTPINSQLELSERLAMAEKRIAELQSELLTLQLGASVALVAPARIETRCRKLKWDFSDAARPEQVAELRGAGC